MSLIRFIEHPRQKHNSNIWLCGLGDHQHMDQRDADRCVGQQLKAYMNAERKAEKARQAEISLIFKKIERSVDIKKGLSKKDRERVKFLVSQAPVSIRHASL